MAVSLVMAVVGAAIVMGVESNLSAGVLRERARICDYDIPDPGWMLPMAGLGTVISLSGTGLMITIHAFLQRRRGPLYWALLTLAAMSIGANALLLPLDGDEGALPGVVGALALVASWLAIPALLLAAAGTVIWRLTLTGLARSSGQACWSPGR
jgi:hypothetical protein